MLNTNRSVALVGCPNVGKSRLFNRLVGHRLSIVHDQPGVTRDVVSAEVRESFLLMDTGGIGMETVDTPDDIQIATEEQVDFAVQAATLIVMVVDAQRGWTPADAQIAQRLRAYNKPIVLAVNKMDNPEATHLLDGFFSAGFGEPIGLSAEHGHGAADLVERIEETLGPRSRKRTQKEDEEYRIKISLVGRPNVGKSSLCNRLLKSDRLIVSNTAGTTRESIAMNMDFTTHNGDIWPFKLVDTAGLRSRKKMDSSLEYFSSLRSERSMETADVVFQVVDAMTGITKVDKKIAGDVVRAGRNLVIVVNKWDYAQKLFSREPIDGYENEGEFRNAFEKAIRKELFFLPDSPILFTSALTDFAVEDIFIQAKAVYKRSQKELSTSKVNKVLNELMEKREPKVESGRRFKIYYALQVGKGPIKFRLFCNQSTRLEDNYERYLKSGFMRSFDLRGCPIVFDLVGKPKETSAIDRIHAKESPEEV